MATFGRTSTQGNYYTAAANWEQVSKFTVGASDLSLKHGWIRAWGYAPYSKVKLCVYSDNSGVPNDLIAVSDELIGLKDGFNCTIWSGGETLTAGTSYWIGFITDYAFNIDAGFTGTNYTVARNYSSGPISPWTGGSSFGWMATIYADDLAFVSSHMMSQESVEAITGGQIITLSQIPIETITGGQVISLTQFPIEIISSNALNLIASQIAIEMVSTNVPDDLSSQRPQLFVIP